MSVTLTDCCVLTLAFYTILVPCNLQSCLVVSEANHEVMTWRQHKDCWRQQWGLTCEGKMKEGTVETTEGHITDTTLVGNVPEKSQCFLHHKSVTVHT